MQVTVPEFQVCLAIRRIMGISRKPRQTQHWVKDDMHDAPFFPKHMPRDRNDQISTCLHFAGQDDYSEENRMWKLGSIIPMLQGGLHSIPNHHSRRKLVEIQRLSKVCDL